ncbi:putative mannitol permease [Serinicoccus hydrothermalis]|uniref:Putative mannitol permease n=1 Tax=Serinicoccus hydrothermalis TaxID=1758689 RepID=A0A1B1NDZ9_9MICO|nr:hypothetical protein [Serinicoccus hydrothermalis]ANS79646.1 putative mannitol permease [Serinicoccus hydrothermalis]
MARTVEQIDQQIASTDPELLPVGEHEKHGAKHFAGLYAAENVAGTEFVFGATFVILGAGIWDVLIGLLIGNALAVLTFWLITTPVAREVGLSVYTYLLRFGGSSISKIYNLANAIVFSVISAAMLTVSATAVQRVIGIPTQEQAYPTHLGFVILVVAFSIVAVLVAVFGFNALAEFATICGPWLAVMFTVGGLVLLPAVAESVTGVTQIGSFREFVDIAGATVFTGVTPGGEEGIGMIEVAGLAWAANSFAHAGMIDMALLRYAKKGWHGLMTSTGMLFGHYVAWFSAGLMGAATAALTLTSITVLSPGDVSWVALGWAGYVTVVVAGWTTANANLYRAGLATQGVFPSLSRGRATLIVGVIVVVVACFPFVYRNYAPLVTWAGVLLAPVGGIVYAEHKLFPRFGLTEYWARYKGVTNMPAILAWGIAFGVGVFINLTQIISPYFAFVPAWIIASLLYVFFAKRAGAAEDYTEDVEDHELFLERVQAYKREQAESLPGHVKDTTTVTRVLRGIWMLALLVILVYAFIVFLDSPDIYTYLTQRNTFYTIAITGTIVYFVCAYWELQRGKVVDRKAYEAAKADAGSPDEGGEGGEKEKVGAPA